MITFTLHCYYCTNVSLCNFIFCLICIWWIDRSLLIWFSLGQCCTSNRIVLFHLHKSELTNVTQQNQYGIDIYYELAVISLHVWGYIYIYIYTPACTPCTFIAITEPLVVTLYPELFQLLPRESCTYHKKN